VGAILLLEEGLGVFGGGNRTGDAGENRQGDECGYDSRHGFSPILQIYPLDQRVGFDSRPTFVARERSYGADCTCEKTFSRMRDKQ
jgi:hypothetical protein